MPLIWPAKDPLEVLDYTWNIIVDDGDSIATATLTKVCGSATINSQVLNGSAITVFVSGGTWGEAVKFRGIVTTSGGRTFEEFIILPICEYQPSTTTKQTIVEMAYEDVGLPGYEFSATPEELFSGIRRLDAMMREWPCGGRLGYNFPTAIGESDPSDPALVPDWAVPAIYGKLAQKLAPAMGKALSSEQKAATATAYSVMLGRMGVPEVNLARGTPRGAGNRSWSGSPFTSQASRCR